MLSSYIISYTKGQTFILTEKAPFHFGIIKPLILTRWGRSSVWLERLPVTQKVASSSLVAPAILLKSG